MQHIYKFDKYYKNPQKWYHVEKKYCENKPHCDINYENEYQPNNSQNNILLYGGILVLLFFAFRKK